MNGFSQISQLLDLYRERIKKHDSNKNGIKKILLEKFNIEVSEKNLLLKKGTLRINGNASLRQQVFLNKKRILLELKDSGVNEVL